MLANLETLSLSLLIPNSNHIKGMRPVKVLDIFEGLTKNFHPDGLFSLETFGRVGEEKRNRLFSYIDLGVPVINPNLYKKIVELKELYREVMAGQTYAVIDESGDLVKSTPTEGQTGYEFFVSVLPTLKFEKRTSPRREFAIKLIDMHRDNFLMDKYIVLPAGLRDYVIDQSGKPSEDEINSLYRKILSISSMAMGVDIKKNLPELDTLRYNLQLACVEVYDYIINILEGKTGFIQGKWASRLTSNTTRNVITSYVNDNTRLFGERSLTTNDNVIGLYQFCRMILPLAINKLRNGFLDKIFPGPDSPALLVDKKTFKTTQVTVESSVYDSWMTEDGIEKFLARFGEEDLHHTFLEVDGHYLGLIYKGPDKTYRFLQSIDELPDHLDKKHVSPITYMELLYIAVHADSHTIPCLVTRYPSIEYGSIYPGWVYLKSTTKSEIRYELGDDWERTGVIAREFPLMGVQSFNSASPNVTHLATLGADFDGDTCSFQSVWTTESREEIKDLLNSKDYYLNLEGDIVFSPSNDISELVVNTLTGE